MSELDFAPSAISVSELNAMAGELLENSLAGFWIAGEISNLTRAASGHYYFSLKDRQAQVRCALFKGAAARLPAPLKEGSQIEVAGKIGIYAARGEFQITVLSVRINGLGQLYEAYERTKRRLHAEGLFSPERKRALPPRPRRIGIVTSPAAAALRDTVSTLRRRAPEIPLIVYPTAVQGKGSESEIARAVQTASERAECDVLIVCRGGGSIEDLWSFNEEAVARAIVACSIPVVSGVGHETDFTLADFAADLRAPTPTAAAELVSPNRTEILQQLSQTQSRLQAALQQRYCDASQRLDWLARQIRHPRQQLAARNSQTAALHHQLEAAAGLQIRLHKQNLGRLQQHLHASRPDTDAALQSLAAVRTALLHRREQLFGSKQHRFAQAAELLEAVSPQHILARGFAVVRNSRGQVVRDASVLKQGQKLHLTFAEGETDVRVIREQAQQDLFDFS
ncbi:MAG: exodeoxyribonuclease VII large subunit [Neisseria sp.]|nr:exodeoxyribonuclease VII large subunit [Neisseria sp.]